jgi:hypothetical protein
VPFYLFAAARSKHCSRAALSGMLAHFAIGSSGVGAPVAPVGTVINPTAGPPAGLSHSIATPCPAASGAFACASSAVRASTVGCRRLCRYWPSRRTSRPDHDSLGRRARRTLRPPAATPSRWPACRQALSIRKPKVACCQHMPAQPPMSNWPHARRLSYRTRRVALAHSYEQKRCTCPTRRCFALGLAGTNAPPQRIQCRVFRARALALRVRALRILPHRWLHVLVGLLFVLNGAAQISHVPG